MAGKKNKPQRRIKRRGPARGVAGGPPPPEWKSRLDQAVAAYEAGHADKAAASATKLLAERPENPHALGLLSMCLVQMAVFDQALETADRALKGMPGDPLLLSLRARALRMLGRTEEALAAFEEVLREQPDSQTAAADMAQLLLALKRTGEAARTLEPFLARDDYGHLIAMAGARVKRAQGDLDAAERIVRSALDRSGHPEGSIAGMLFILAEVLDEAGRTDEAFETLRRANERRTIGRFEASAHAAAIDRGIRALTPEAFDRMPARRPEPGEPRPIFVVGVPRSGTTLVERILGAHSAVVPCGEIGEISLLVQKVQGSVSMSVPSIIQHPQLFGGMTLGMIAKQYLAEAPPAARSAEWYTDKMPGNVLYAPIIRKMFPDSPIIFCARDPRDSALSCYFQNFGSTLAWAYRPEDIASYFRDVDRAVAHFRNELGIEMVEVRYEDLVASPEPRIRRLLGEVGLSWEEACLRPHEQAADARTRSVYQVTKPIYGSSAGKWRRYQAHLDAMFEGVAGCVHLAGTTGTG